MDNIKNDPYYANRIREDLTFIVTHMKGNVDLDIVLSWKSKFQFGKVNPYSADCLQD